jgi:hypothetical protein
VPGRAVSRAAAIFVNMRTDHRPVDRGHNERRKGAAFQALLGLDVLVAGQKHLKTFALNQ